MSAGFYRKRPVVIRAWQFNGQWRDESPDWLRDRQEITFYGPNEGGGDARYLTIETLEGQHRADIGDWIICGVAGELYPCKPAIFAQTYEAAEGPH